MNLLNDFAFAAVDTYLKNEVQKQIDRWISETAANQLLGMIPDSGRAVPMPIKGTVNAVITGITLDYTGTAMKKTQERTVRIPDLNRTISLDRMIPARRGATIQEGSEQKNPISAEISLQTDVVLKEIGLSGGVGGLRAEVNGIRFKAELKLLVNRKG